MIESSGVTRRAFLQVAASVSGVLPSDGCAGRPGACGVVDGSHCGPVGGEWHALRVCHRQERHRCQSVEGAAELPYAIPNVLIDLHTTHDNVPVWWWRSVGRSFNAFAVELLDAVADVAGWPRKLSDGVHRGIAVHASLLWPHDPGLLA